MSLLLDTHVVLWWLNDDPTLTDDLKDRLDHDPDVYVSSASVWEVAVKQAIGKLTGPSDLPERFETAGSFSWQSKATTRLRRDGSR